MVYLNTQTEQRTEEFIDGATTISVDDIRVANFFEPVPTGFERKLIDGTYEFIAIPWDSEDEVLTKAKNAKLSQIEEDYKVADTQPILYQTTEYNGGEESVTSIDKYVRLNRLAGQTSHVVWDRKNVDHEFTDAEVNGLILTIGAQVSGNKFSKKNRKLAIANIALSVTNTLDKALLAVEAI